MFSTFKYPAYLYTMFIRFDIQAISKGQKSFNHFTGEELMGVCCFPLFDDESYCLQIREYADKFANYVKFADGHFVVFEGSYVEDNFNGEGVIAKVDEVFALGQVVSGEYGYVITEYDEII